jgi:hypothetical protein
MGTQPPSDMSPEVRRTPQVQVGLVLALLCFGAWEEFLLFSTLFRLNSTHDNV